MNIVRQHTSVLKRIQGLIIAVLLLIIMVFGATAQTLMPLPAHASTYTGYSRGYWFVAPTSFFIVGVRAPTDASATAPYSVFLVRFAATPPAYAASTTAYTVLGSWMQVPGTAMTSTGNILVNTGDIIGIIGHRSTIPATNFNAINSYGSVTPTSNILGYPVTLTRLLYQDNIDYNMPGALSQEAGGQIGRVEIYVAPPCQFPANIATMDIVDNGGNPIAYANIPSAVFAKYSLNYPAGTSNFTATVTFEKVGVASPVVPTSKYVVVLNDAKLAGITLNNMQQISLPATLEPGYYSISTRITSKNSCGNYDNFDLAKATLMLVYPGTTPCVVWPGDVNNDGLVNYGDRKSLNKYIYDANLRSSWLTGPARYMINPLPLAFLAWTPQASVPWATSQGCYMDADGNGVINNFDYVAVKLNWMRDHPASPKDGIEAAALQFDVMQNYPNPFNPTTKITYSVPEPSIVRMVVNDQLGRSVATLVDGRVEAGVFDATFDGASLHSGAYIVTVAMQGIESGLRFTKTMKMVLTK